MGNSRDALALIINELKDIQQVCKVNHVAAMSFYRDQYLAWLVFSSTTLTNMKRIKAGSSDDHFLEFRGCST